MPVVIVSPAGQEVPLPAWFLAYSKPRSESVVLAQLQHQAYEAYLPLYKTLRRAPGGMAEHRDPMFPRYVFFRPAQAGQSIAPVRSTLGVSGIVRFGITPATVGDELIQALRRFERERELVDPAMISPLRAGSRVAICAGPLKGLEGLVCGTTRQRVKVLLDLLGRQPHVIIPNHHLQLLAA